MVIDAHSAALLILRLALAVAYLVAALFHTFTGPGWQATLHSTAVFLRKPEVGPYSRTTILCARVSLIWLFLGGLGVLFGIFTTLSAVAIAAFAVLGQIIHSREGALVVARTQVFGKDHPREVRDIIDRLLISATTGNAGAGIKNVPIVAAAVLLIIDGPGRYSLSTLLGVA